ncbi:MAG: carbohydrate kinase family protein [Phycisphaerales bacterium]
MSLRAQIARSAADTLAAASMPPCLVGFDGFIDSITDMVDRRHTMSPEGYSRLPTIASFAERCAAAAGRSTNIERVVKERRFGGNGPLMAGALARLGCPTAFIGAIGAESETPGAIHPTFAEFASWCDRVIPICPPCETVCLEFDDGKLMLNETSGVQRVTWPRLVEAIGLDQIRAAVERARLLGIVNWSLMGGVPGIWEGLIRDVLPAITAAPRRLMIDLSDPAKRSDPDIADALAILARLEAAGMRVTLGLNLAEAVRLDAVADTRMLGDPDINSDRLVAAADSLRRCLRIDTIVIHPRQGAAAATPHDAGWFDGPLTPRPRLSTGAGDHFNAGFALAQALSLPLAQCLAVGCAESGVYVRDARSPDCFRLLEFLRDLPQPEI